MSAILGVQQVSGQDFQPGSIPQGDRADQFLAFRLAVLMMTGSTGTSSIGLPFAAVRVVVFTLPILSTTSMPSITLPKTA